MTIRPDPLAPVSASDNQPFDLNALDALERAANPQTTAAELLQLARHANRTVHLSRRVWRAGAFLQLPAQLVMSAVLANPALDPLHFRFVIWQVSACCQWHDDACETHLDPCYDEAIARNAAIPLWSLRDPVWPLSVGGIVLKTLCRSPQCVKVMQDMLLRCVFAEGKGEERVTLERTLAFVHGEAEGRAIMRAAVRHHRGAA